MALKGNKGDWSEVYVLLKSLSDGALFAGDANANEISQLFYPIIRIIRDQADISSEYNIIDNIVFISQCGVELCSLGLGEFTDKALVLFEAIKGGSSTFEVPQLESFLNQIKCTSLKAKSSKKSDIRIVIHDSRTGQMPELGFSIKSQLGGASTLLNSGKTTNFIYKITDSISRSVVDEINAISTKSKVRDRVKAICKNGVKLDFRATQKSVFGNNLLLIDSQLPKIISELLLLYYSGEGATLVDLVKRLEQLNPLGFDQSFHHDFYTYKIKRFLTDVALGMMPATVWTGAYEATGGCLIVKDNGDILCYHIYHRNEFENYLLNNTKLETASSTRHGFGTIYESDGDLYMNLNLQIRFKK